MVATHIVVSRILIVCYWRNLRHVARCGVLCGSVGGEGGAEEELVITSALVGEGGRGREVRGRDISVEGS